MTGPAADFLVDVGPVAAGGGCVGRADDGRVVFVRHALPGEQVMARVTAETTSYLRADAIEVRRASPDRVVAPCPHAGPGRCGGCDWQHVSLARQRALKADLVSEQLRRLAGVDPAVVVEAVPGAAADGLGWRTRVQFSVDRTGRSGLRRHRSHQLEPLERCLLAAPGVEAVGVERERWPGVEAVEVVTSADGAQRLVSVTSARGTRGRLRRLPEVDAGVVIDGQPERPPLGIRHAVLGRSFEVSAGVFWQVHPGGAEMLARVVLDGLAPRAGDRVVDLYAGAGLFAALLGDAVGPGGSVIAVEGDRRAAADAARNTSDQVHVKVRTAAVTAHLVGSRAGRADLIVLDPPRAGAGREVTAALAALRPRRMAYVACDPASFARDLRVLLDAGWEMAALRAFDLFPMTEHVELAALLTPPGA